MTPVHSDDRVGDYVLERRLGRGAIGEVWLGRHVRTNAPAAVKVMHARSTSIERNSFELECRAIARLSHPHIVTLFEVSERHFAMAYIDGPTLLRRARTPLHPGLAIGLIRQVASALMHAHERGVIHSDVKPGNILLDRRGNAYLADFGVAQIRDRVEATGRLRGGTPGFMAPEQERGHTIDAAADQYALAKTLACVLLGKNRPGAPGTDELAPLRPEIRSIIEKGTRHEASQRFDSIGQWADALGELDLSAEASPHSVRPPIRAAAPFAWVAQGRARAAVTVDIERIDFRLSDLERTGTIRRGDGAEFRAQTGYAEFGWALYGRTSSLGPLGTPSALARATELVVLLHGWSANREVWSRTAADVCRDNPSAAVLVPDVSGFGESTFRSVPPPFSQVRPPAIADAICRWLRLLGLAELPRVLVGHSMSAFHLLLALPETLGPQCARLAITPVAPFVVPAYRRRLRVSAKLGSLLARSPRLFRWSGERAIMKGVSTRDLTREARDAMLQEYLRTPPSVMAQIAGGMASAEPLRRGEPMSDCILLIGQGDRAIPEGAVEDTLRMFELPRSRLHHLATGGHYPHLESAEHPEWTARNMAQIAALVDTLLISANANPASSPRDATTTLIASPGAENKPTTVLDDDDS